MNDPKPSPARAQGGTRPGDAGRRAAALRAQRYRHALGGMLAAIVQERPRTTAAIAEELSRRDVRKPRGGTVWTPADLHKLLRRLELEAGSDP